MAVNDYFRVALVGSLFEQEIVNVFHYQQTNGNTSGITDVESLARAFNAGMAGVIAQAAAQDATWGLIESRSMPVPPVPMTGYDYAISLAGAQEDTAAPPTVAWIIKKKTAFLGRKYRGRNFFAGIGQSFITAGQINPASFSIFEAVRDAIVATLTWTLGGSPTFRPVIATLVTPPLPDVPFIRGTPVTVCQLDPILRSQRRREIGVGA